MKNRCWIVVSAMVALILSSKLSVAEEGEGKAKSLEERMNALENRTEVLEKEVNTSHKNMLEDMQFHLQSLDRTLEMVDYRTGRIKAMEQKINAFTLGGDLTLIPQGFAGDRSKIDASFSGDVFLIAPAGPYGNVYFRGDIGQGAGIPPLMPITFTSTNADLEFNDDGVHIVEAWYWTEIPFPDVKDKRLELTVGKVTAASFFDNNKVANSETDQFMGQMFVNNLAIPFQGRLGGDVNGYGPGVTLSYRFTPITEKGLKVVAKIGAFEGDGDFQNVFNKPFTIAELDIWKPYYGLNGNYRFYAWMDKTDHTDLKDWSQDDLSTLTDPATGNRSNYGFGLSFDQQVSTDVTLFARYGMQDRNVSFFDHNFSVGGQLVGNSWKRGNDRIGLAYGASHASGKYRKANPEAGGSYEHHVEVYYKYWVNSNVSISPDIQYIINPAANDNLDDIFVYGLRTQVTF